MFENAMLLRANDAAKTLAISPRLLWRLTKQGVIPCCRLGRAVRYDPDVLRTWIKRFDAVSAA
jgi:predicted DNA-binding transcriptional regulator AlpA